MTLVKRVRAALSPIRRTPALLSRYVASFVGEFRHHAASFQGQLGLEIGGPSDVFRRFAALPVYALARRVDGVNFSSNTMWEGRISEGMTYEYARGHIGRQFIGEASNLSAIRTGAYDFLISSHALEHCANPLKAMSEWRRVIRPGGLMLVVLPRRQDTFDHFRPITPFEHLLEDESREVDETDLTHLDEIVALHDLTRDAPGLTRESYLARALKNHENRGLHHHVFDEALMRRMLAHVQVTPLFTDYARPMHLIVLGRVDQPSLPGGGSSSCRP